MARETSKKDKCRVLGVESTPKTPFLGYAKDTETKVNWHSIIRMSIDRDLGHQLIDATNATWEILFTPVFGSIIREIHPRARRHRLGFDIDPRIPNHPDSSVAHLSHRWPA
jgi:hypothetical protein